MLKNRLEKEKEVYGWLELGELVKAEVWRESRGHNRHTMGNK